LIDLESVERSVAAAAAAHKEGNFARAVGLLTRANNAVTGLLKNRDAMWKDLKAVWEKSRYEKGRSVAGLDFLHVLDDVKDHWADRRTGLDYMIAPFQRMKLPEWRKNLAEIINQYAAAHNVPVQGLEQPRLED
ncbi:MAG TPA: hypothetical protein VJ417_10835, partial [Candidatus Glassbacteria bacterium]|nr:hypothetical protein [Candidatus Glassbacteria bacterium]